MGTYQVAHTTPQWLLQYGFVMEDNLVDYIHLSIPDVPMDAVTLQLFSELPVVNVRFSISLRITGTDKEYLCLLGGGSNRWPPSKFRTLQFLRFSFVPWWFHR